MEEIVRLQRSADTLLMKAVQSVGKLAGGMVATLGGLSPEALKSSLEKLFSGLLYASLQIDRLNVVRHAPLVANRAVVAATGAAGGVFGIAGLLPDLAISTTVIFNSIGKVARNQGFDPEDMSIRAECLAVFASGGPGNSDDSAMEAFISHRGLINGQTVSALVQKSLDSQLVARAAEKFALTLNTRLPSQAVPILGALSGAAVNLAFVSYYEKMAEVHFRILRLSELYSQEEISAAYAAVLARPVRKARWRLGKRPGAEPPTE